MGKFTAEYWDAIFLVALSVFTLASRWLYKSVYLFHWDSVQFALSLHDFNLSLHQPHPPGYILYIWLARLMRYFIQDDNLALVSVSILFTIVGLVGVFYLTRSIFRNRLAAYIVAIFYVVNASVWFHGLVAEIYIVDSAIAIWVIFMLHRAWLTRTLQNLLIGVALLGLLGGFRQSTEVALLPLLVYVLIVSKTQLRQYLRIGLVWVAANLVWAIPLIANIDGLSRYLLANRRLVDVVFLSDFDILGIWPKLVKNIQAQTDALRTTMPAEMIVLFFAAAPYLTRGRMSKYNINWPYVWFW